jgi:hypothetical protein
MGKPLILPNECPAQKTTSSNFTKVKAKNNSESWKDINDALAHRQRTSPHASGLLLFPLVIMIIMTRLLKTLEKASRTIELRKCENNEDGNLTLLPHWLKSGLHMCKSSSEV